MARILVVEDDASTLSLVGKGLKEAGYEVQMAADGAAGLECAKAGGYDLVILDVLLPHCDGWSLLTQMRRVDLRTPVLMLSALDGVEHKVRGLSIGADDYLTKPFSFEELVSRINAICRRLSRPGMREINLDDLRLDDRSMTAYRGATKIPLTPKEFELLALLASRKGEVLSRRLIAAQVWDLTLDSESNVVEVNIRRLRRKVDDPFARKLIHTLRGRGYVMR
jgi:two-component system copper resistance phosphate regulon response regulator CusR